MPSEGVKFMAKSRSKVTALQLHHRHGAPRLKKQKQDPWEDFSTTKQKIAVNYLKALKIEAT